MQLTIPHTLPASEVQRRLQARAHEIAKLVPGGMAQVSTCWPCDTHMDMTLSAMGKTVTGSIDIAEDHALFVVKLPASLALFSGLIAAKLDEKGRKLLA